MMLMHENLEVGEKVSSSHSRTFFFFFCSFLCGIWRGWCRSRASTFWWEDSLTDTLVLQRPSIDFTCKGQFSHRKHDSACGNSNVALTFIRSEKITLMMWGRDAAFIALTEKCNKNIQQWANWPLTSVCTLCRCFAADLCLIKVSFASSSLKLCWHAREVQRFDVQTWVCCRRPCFIQQMCCDAHRLDVGDAELELLTVGLQMSAALWKGVVGALWEMLDEGFFGA